MHFVGSGRQTGQIKVSAPCDVFHFWSLHSGGANFLMADGSVHFLKSSTAMQTVWALGSRAQGEVLSSDAY